MVRERKCHLNDSQLQLRANHNYGRITITGESQCAHLISFYGKEDCWQIICRKVINTELAAFGFLLLAAFGSFIRFAMTI